MDDHINHSVKRTLNKPCPIPFIIKILSNCEKFYLTLFIHQETVKFLGKKSIFLKKIPNLREFQTPVRKGSYMDIRAESELVYYNAAKPC